MTSIDAATLQNADGSYDIYISPQPPDGEKVNSIQSIPGKGWNMLWRIYGARRSADLPYLSQKSALIPFCLGSSH